MNSTTDPFPNTPREMGVPFKEGGGNFYPDRDQQDKIEEGGIIIDLISLPVFLTQVPTPAKKITGVVEKKTNEFSNAT